MFAVLALALAAAATASAQMTLAPSKYDAYACMARVKAAVMPRLEDIEGNALRYAFHDCGTWGGAADACSGCTGGIRLTIANSVKMGVYNTSFDPHGEDGGMLPTQTMLVGVNGKGGLCRSLKRTVPACAGMPIADCINFAGYLAVVKTGGAPSGGCGWYPGRTDAPDTCIQTTSRLPSEKANAAQLKATFEAYQMPDQPASAWGFTPLGSDGTGFDLLSQTVVNLIGSHTIGRSREHDKALCSKGINTLGATPKAFDNDYYQRIVGNANKIDNNGGWLCADMHGVCNTIVYGNGVTQTGARRLMKGGDMPDLTKGYCAGKKDSPFEPIYAYYAAQPAETFKQDFCKAYQRMSLIGYKFPADYATVSAQFKSLLM